MNLTPSRPTREFKFKVSARTTDGEVVDGIVSVKDEKRVAEILQSLGVYGGISPALNVDQITIDVGDRQETWIGEDEKPLPGVQTVSDLNQE